MRKVPEVIITCHCGDTDKYAKDAYKIVFPGHKPVIMRYDTGEVENQPDLFRHFMSKDEYKAVCKGKPFAFAVHLPCDYDDEEVVYDLLKGEYVI